MTFKNLFAILFLSTLVSAQYVPVTAKLADGAGNVSDTAYLHFDLENCGPYFPTISGSSVIVQTSFDLKPNQPDGSILGQVVANDVILCNNVTSTLWKVTAMRNASQALTPSNGLEYQICSNPAGCYPQGGTWDFTVAEQQESLFLAPSGSPYAMIISNAIWSQTWNQPPGTVGYFIGDFDFTNATVTGLSGGGGGGGTPNQTVSFTSQTFASITLSTSTNAVTWDCWDSNGRGLPSTGYSVDIVSGVVQFTFPFAQSGYCVVNTSGGGSGSGPFQSLTTTGSSGAATLSAGVLNIPQYSGGGSMTWPAAAGIANYSGSSSWGTSYSSSNTIPNNFLGTLVSGSNGLGTGAFATIANYLPLAGGTMTGELVTHLSAVGSAGLNLPQGAAPTSPNNGDVWTTSSGLYAQIAGSTVGPFGTGSGGMIYPAAGIGNSTGSAWGTSYSTSGTGTIVALAASPALTGLPTITGADQGGSPVAGIATITDIATSSTDTSTDLYVPVPATSYHQALNISVDAFPQFGICNIGGASHLGMAVVGNVSGIAGSPCLPSGSWPGLATSNTAPNNEAKLTVFDNTAQHTGVRIYNNSASQSNTMFELNSASTSGFNFFQACTGVTNFASGGYGSCSGGTVTAGLSSAGLFTGSAFTAGSGGIVTSPQFCIGGSCITAWPVGTVTSVTQTVPTGFAIGGSPVTTSGTLAITTTGLTTNTIQKAVSGGLGNSTVLDDGTKVSTTEPFVSSTYDTCPDTSASGTAQVCNTTPTFTAVAGSCVTYTTTTANTGASLTLNVNSLGAKSVAKWQGATTLAANDVLANKEVQACYDGTNWELAAIGNAPSGSGTVNSGTSGHLGYYASSAAAISDMGADFTFLTHTLSAGASAILDLSAASGTAAFKVPVAATNTATAAGAIVFDSTNKNYHGYVNAADALFLAIAAAPTTGHLFDSSVSSGNTLAHDSGIATANVVTASSPGAGIAHFAGSTQAETSGPVVLTAEVSGVLPFANMSQSFVVNAQTATYQVLAADFTACKTIPVASGTFTITLVASGSQPASGQCLRVVNYGSGVVTIARSGQNINGGTTSLTVPAGSATIPTGAFVVSDGTNYEALPFASDQGTVTSIIFSSPLSGGTVTTTGTIACATCVTSAAPLTSTALMTGGGSQASQTPSSVATLNSSGQMAVAQLIASGIVDGTAPITVTTGTTATLGAATYQSGYTFNQEATAGTGVTYTLPATVKGNQFCVKNSIVSGTGAADTGTLIVYPAASSYVIYNGVRNTIGGGGTHGMTSTSGAGASACFVAIDATDWEVYAQVGTWTEN